MIPKKAEVLGLKIKVSNKKLSDSDVPDGAFNGKSKKIWINPNNSKEDQWRTFWHEIGHAVMFRNGHTFSGMSHEMEETLVETYATAIYELIEQMDKGWHERS